jgi:hypothetical protein
VLPCSLNFVPRLLSIRGSYLSHEGYASHLSADFGVMVTVDFLNALVCGALPLKENSCTSEESQLLILMAGYANMYYIFSAIAEPVGDKGAPRKSMNERNLEAGA